MWPKGLSRDESIKEIGYCSAVVTRRGFLLCVTTWTELEGPRLSKVSQTLKDKHCTYLHPGDIWKVKLLMRAWDAGCQGPGGVGNEQLVRGYILSARRRVGSGVLGYSPVSLGEKLAHRLEICQESRSEVFSSRKERERERERGDC